MANKLKTLMLKHMAKHTLVHPFNMAIKRDAILGDMREDNYPAHQIEMIKQFYDGYTALYLKIEKSGIELESLIEDWVDELLVNRAAIQEDILTITTYGTELAETIDRIREVNHMRAEFNYSNTTAILGDTRKTAYVILDEVEYASRLIPLSTSPFQEEDEWMIVYTPSQINFHTVGSKSDVVKRMLEVIQAGGVVGVFRTVENEWSGRDTIMNQTLKTVTPKIRIEENYDYE